MLGDCIYTGYFADDENNIATYLQDIINNNDYKYNVVNLAVPHAYIFDIYHKVLEHRLGANDIVIVSADYTSYDSNIIPINWGNIAQLFPEQHWYWDSMGHCNYDAYKIIANQLFDVIRPQLITDNMDYKFCLEPDLESKLLEYIEETKIALRQSLVYKKQVLDSVKSKIKAGAIVMNCNPFTLGHQYLIETAARLVDILYIFVVEEDKSEFAFSDRYVMVQEGCKHIDNTVVLKSGKFIISSTTFSGYFKKDKPSVASYDSFLDLKIFAHYIAPALDISIRFVGEEPFDKVTAQYNEDMKVLLPEQGIIVLEVPRKNHDNNVISATSVRKLLKDNRWEELESLVPDTTINVLQEKYSKTK